MAGWKFAVFWLAKIVDFSGQQRKAYAKEKLLVYGKGDFRGQ